jgi:alpha-galactosidase
VKQAGFTPGLWLAPFVVQPGSRLAHEHPDWLLRKQNGKPIRSGFFYKFFGYALDATHPAVQQHISQLIGTLIQEWGYALLKLDFLYAAALPGIRHDPHATRAQALRVGLEVIRQAAGEQTFLLGCGCPFGPAIGLVDGMRIGADTAPHWQPSFNWAPWARSLLRDHPSPPSLRNSLRNTLNLSSLHRRWWWNDPDCLLVRSQDTQLTEDEIRSSITLTGLSGGMVVDSDDLSRLPAQRLELLSLLAPLLSPGGQPLDLLEQDMPELYHVPVQGAAGRWHLLALFNWQDRPLEKRFSLARLGISPGQSVYVFDFWVHCGFQPQSHEITIPVIPAHGCRLLRICELASDVNPTPQLLADTLHITQGMEIAEWRIEQGSLSIQTINLNRQAAGEIWLALPRPPEHAVCNGSLLEIKPLGDGVYCFHLAFSGQAEIKITFTSFRVSEGNP